MPLFTVIMLTAHSPLTFFCLLQLFPDVLLLAAEPKRSSIIRVTALWARKSPWGSARPTRSRWDSIREHGRVLHGARSRWWSWPHWTLIPSLLERPGVCDHSGGPPPQPLCPLSTARNQPNPFWLHGEPGHASIILHSHIASTVIMPLHSQSHSNCWAARGQEWIQENALAVTDSLPKNDKTGHCQSVLSQYKYKEHNPARRWFLLTARRNLMWLSIYSLHRRTHKQAAKFIPRTWRTDILFSTPFL